jgi:hypothetical protein
MNPHGRFLSNGRRTEPGVVLIRVALEGQTDHGSACNNILPEFEPEENSNVLLAMSMNEDECGEDECA